MSNLLPAESAPMRPTRLPEEIKKYLKARGISDEIQTRFSVGWNGQRITIPIFDREGHLAFFKLARSPNAGQDVHKMIASPGSSVELYGWDSLLKRPQQIVICEGEFDRLVLESRGFPAVTSTGGALSFKEEWASHFKSISEVYVCFDNDGTGREGARRVVRMIPRAKVIGLPDEVGEGGDVTDFFVRLGHDAADFQELMAAARPMPIEPRTPRTSDGWRHRQPIAGVSIEQVAARYLAIKKSGVRFLARCPFHDDRHPSFVIYPQTQSFYCFGCRAHGDTIDFLMRMERLTFRQAVVVLNRISQDHG